MKSVYIKLVCISSMAVLFLSVFYGVGFLPDAMATVCFGTCPSGQWFDQNCNCVSPLPEMEVMMVPVAMGIAGIFAMRVRRRAMQGKDNDNNNTTA